MHCKAFNAARPEQWRYAHVAMHCLSLMVAAARPPHVRRFKPKRRLRRGSDVFSSRRELDRLHSLLGCSILVFLIGSCRFGLMPRVLLCSELGVLNLCFGQLFRLVGRIRTTGYVILFTSMLRNLTDALILTKKNKSRINNQVAPA